MSTPKSRRRTPNTLQIGHIQLARILDRTQEVARSRPSARLGLLVVVQADDWRELQAQAAVKES
jgi:hypothetical protein